jgi:translation initiation factor SUI1
MQKSKLKLLAICEETDVMICNFLFRNSKLCFLHSLIQEFACNGTVIEHPEYGEVLQLQGDQRENICQFLTKMGLVKQDQLKVHGF